MLFPPTATSLLLTSLELTFNYRFKQYVSLMLKASSLEKLTTDLNQPTLVRSSENLLVYTTKLASKLLLVYRTYY